jgi:hypothetical protein
MRYINGIKRQQGNPYRDYPHDCPECKQSFYIAAQDVSSNVERELSKIECPECYYIEVATFQVVYRG